MSTVAFNEAAKLYTKHAQVVQAIERAYKANLDDFWQQLFDELEAQADGWEWTWRTKGSWFQLRPPKSKGPMPYFHTDWYDASIVTDGRIILTAAKDKATPAELKALSALKSRPGCKARQGSAYYLFDLIVPCKEGTPVAQIAAPVVETFRAMVTAMNSVQDNRTIDAEKR